MYHDHYLSKVFNAHYPRRITVIYLVNSLHLEPLTLLVIGLALVAGLARGDWVTRALALGVALHVLYVVRVGGDFMSGRFLSAPFLVAVVIGSRVEVRKEWQLRIASVALVVIAAAAGTFPTLSWWYLSGHPRAKDAYGIADHRRELHVTAGLWDADHARRMPSHRWVERGIRFRAQKVGEVVRLGGTGFTGFFAGPEVHIVDMWALTDPLLARLPFEELNKGRGWRPGHFHRPMPEGYLETLRSGRNVIADPDLAAYYDKLALITRGDLLAPGRLEAIWQINTGGYDHLIEAYVKRKTE